MWYFKNLVNMHKISLIVYYVLTMISVNRTISVSYLLLNVTLTHCLVVDFILALYVAAIF
jgi:hypothetical protein